MQKYKFTCLHVEFKSTTLQCDQSQNTPHTPCFAPSSASPRADHPLLPRSVRLLVAKMEMTMATTNTTTVVSKLWELGRKTFFVSRAAEVPPGVGDSSFKRWEALKRTGLRSALFQRRDLGVTEIIHEHNITQAVHGEQRRWLLPPPPPFHCPFPGLERQRLATAPGLPDARLARSLGTPDAKTKGVTLH